MKLGIMQPYFIPYIGYFQMIHAVDKYIIYSDVNFSKRGWSNRNRILLKDGTIHTLTVPLAGQSSRLRINQIEIFNQKKWETGLLSTIYMNYKGSNYFDEVYPFLMNMFKHKFKYLYQLNGYLVDNICSFIGIQTIIEYENSNRYPELEEQLIDVGNNNYSHFQYMEKLRPEKKVARIVEICKAENATVYINAIGGQNLYSKEEFSNYGIDLKFIKTEEIVYPQFTQEFEPNLSIVDVLMHNGSVGTKKLLQKYTLK